MLNSIKAYFEAKLNTNDESDGELSTSSSNLASAALLIEVMKSDHELDHRESDEFMALMQSSLNIPAEELEAMRELAEAQASQSIAADALAQRDSVSAVNLDEEAMSLIQYQQSYQANAKVISASQQLFNTLLSMF